MDIGELAIGGALILPLISGLVEFSKRLGLSGNALTVEAFLLGGIFAAVAGAISEGLIPALALPWVRVAAIAIGGAIAGMSVSGNYDLLKRAVQKWAAR